MATVINEDVAFNKLKQFCEINQQFLIAFEVTEKNSALSRAQKNDLHLHYVARNILQTPQYFQDTIDHFSQLLPKLISLAIRYGDKPNPRQHKLNCVLLAKLIENRPDLGGYATKYFERFLPPFAEQIETPVKKRKMRQVTVSDLDLAKSSYLLLKSNPGFYRTKWNWSEFINKFLNHKTIEIQWIACRCLSIVTAMNEKQTRRFVASRVPRELDEKFCCTYNFSATPRDSDKTTLVLDRHPCISISGRSDEQVTEISGVYIPKLAGSGHFRSDLVMVESTRNNLQKVALGLNSGKAVCLQGPVGSGKTTLVEYLAGRTGRKLGENFVKIQLGDQTDSKMLLGTYRCTDIPGEFVWQPGVVTQAVLEGHWLLLEDIDSASIDIASVLSSLLENGTLTVPGYRDSLSTAPGFQLFFTQRFVTTITGHHKKHSNTMTLLEKHLLQINIDPVSLDELRTILITLYPKFTRLADRMLKVFQLFSASLRKSGRLTSTRDFFKWCLRAAIDFDVKSQASTLKVLQDAIDVFCCSYSSPEEALNLAVDISSLLGIVNEKAHYFFKNYKPTLELTADSLAVGRASIVRDTDYVGHHLNYYFTRPSTVLLERIMVCVSLREPVLLVGETGTGKTSSVQYLANTVGKKLIVINMNQQSDSADLLGGFKPVELKFVVTPIKREFEDIFAQFFQVGPNKTFLGHIAYCYNEQRWGDLVKLMTKSCEAALQRLTKAERDDKMFEKWHELGVKLEKLSLQLKQKAALAFAFIEGSLVKAVERGHWVLLDEINLANAETLECLSGLLEGSGGSLCLLERGDKEPVKRHPNFTLFACMNPSTDVGKKDLPAGLRNRFTEFYVDELTEKSDLLLLVSSYLDAQSLKDCDLEKIVDFYLKVRRETETTLTDGLGHKPHFSLRSLCRALVVAARNPCGMFKRSLYEGFCLSFLTQLDATSYLLVEKLIGKYLIGNDRTLKSVLKQPIPPPKGASGDSYLQFEGYWVRKGNLECAVPNDYVLTESVRKNLKDLVRIVSIGGLPVLLQGDTSVGKTSLITYLAKSSGNKCVRINNHEHTDLQEYIGSYMADCEGKLVFREGLLVEAMRKGHWIILDELNLAPTDVLEALNRVLDDNRELFIPETQETIKADPNFMLFATQNPPGSYGGRKMLSRAFRNRFVELHFNEIPSVELAFILHQRCQMPASYAKKMIAVMTDLQMRRRGSAAFAGKQGFITLRDLFRWGERYRLAQNTQKLYDWDQHLADEGYLVLAGRVRKTEEKNEIIGALQKHLKREVEPQHLFSLSEKTSVVTRGILAKIYENTDSCKNIVWTYNMRQLAVLVGKAFQFKEPVLLVGETGGGKTTVCQLIAEQNKQQLVTVNCHMHTESSDFIGGLRPVRDHVGDDVNKLFEWVDGPLIHAMVQGNVFLADEISLADDSVLERLNSLLEPERTLLLAEKGTDINNANNSELIVANPRFHFIGTMNPGGDFGKKELSPALRNRFTEIWCESCTNRDDLIAIVERNVQTGISFGNQQDGSTGIGTAILDFIGWFRQTEIGKRFTVSIRDILTWVHFINNCAEKMEVQEAFLHGACLTFLDGLGSGITGTENVNSVAQFRNDCLKFVQKQTKSLHQVSEIELRLEQEGNSVGIKPFYVDIGNEPQLPHAFSFNAPTTIYNTLRLLRGMQLNKAILLEGSPGVGKTSLVVALTKFTRHKVFRVNLSDQTDVSDLFGADLPVEGGSGGQFSWRDGPLLQALKQGHWILLDELNLASQSVLEGLNACLDHRGEIFIPELAKTFHVKPGTRFFACQNPLKQGGSRRGLPQSFLNRFIQVYVNPLSSEDLGLILRDQFPHLPRRVLEKMLEFNLRIVRELESYTFGHKGAPWEFNLRDLTRWCEVTSYNFQTNPNTNKQYRPESYVELIYGDRMRTLNDKIKINKVFEEVFECEISGNRPVLYVNDNAVHIGDVSFDKNFGDLAGFSREKESFVLRSQLPVLRSLALCVNLNWMSLLVGSSASGKSAVVRALANLAGKTLRTLPVTSAMDTTDILGGFEQTDYCRHLEEVVKETERLVLETLQLQLVNGDASGLLRLWESRSGSDKGGDETRTMREETELFLTRLEKLENIWALLPSSPTLEKLRAKAEVMKKCVESEGSLNAGGKFEWVDSVLIKCLQEGSWLLIDNVNLCSAAVLDRLNALLEPRGVLTVGERGIDANGKMVEIAPHPQFRLFLTMDPKNGEISRAMRNRGLEIYMLNEKEAERRNVFDLKSLISREGLKDVALVNTLLTLHDFVSDSVLGEKPNVNELLRASYLISQQLRNGIDQKQAFTTAITEVYYKARPEDEFGTNDFVTVIQNKVAETLESLGSNQTELYSDDVTLGTQQLQFRSDLEKIKQQAALVSKFCSNPGLTTTLKCLLVNFYAIASPEDLDLRHLYLSTVLSRGSADHLREISDALMKLIKSLKVPNNDSPLDCRWTPETFCTAGNVGFGNRVVLALNFVASLAEEKLTQGKSDEISLIQYIKLKQKKQVTDQFNDVLIDDFLVLISEFDAFLLKALETAEMSDEVSIQILYLLSWRFLLYRCGYVNVKKITNARRNLIQTNLRVHYRWFYKNCITRISSGLRQQLPKQLGKIVKTINDSLDSQFSDLHKTGRNYQRYNLKPPPRVSEAEIEIAVVLHETARKFDVCDKNNDPVKIINVFKSEKELRSQLIKLRTVDELNALSDLTKGSVHSCYEIEILPFIDYFVQSIVRSSMPLHGRNCLTVPLELVRSFLLQAETGDDRLRHAVTKSLFIYLTNSATVRSGLYYGETDDVTLTGYNPLLSHHLTKLLVTTDSAITKFGNFRDLIKQHRLLNLTLWRNLPQIGDSDYLHCERLFIAESFETFMRQLAQTLGLSTNNDLKQLSQVCLKRLKSLGFIGHLEKCIGNFFASNLNGDGQLLAISLVYMELGYIKAVFNSKLPLIDPSAKNALKKKYCAESIGCFEEFRGAFVMLNEVYSGNEKTLHPHCKPAVEMLKTLRAKNEKLGNYVAVRPKDVLYEDVVKIITYGFSTVLSDDYVTKAITLLDRSVDDLLKGERFAVEEGAKVLKQYESALASYENLIYEWSRYSCSYPDVVEPLLANVAEFLYGFKLGLSLLRKVLWQRQHVEVNLQKTLSDLIKLPSVNQNELIETYTSTKLHNFIGRILENAENPKIMKQEVLRLFKCGIQETFNSCIIEAKSTDVLSKELFFHFEKLLKAFLKAWNQQDKEREAREKEAESLYKMKTKCDDKTEDEQIAEELKQLFPNYHDTDFSDMQNSPELMSSESIDKTSDEFSGCISHEDVKFVAKTHLLILQNFTKTEWLNPEKNHLSPDFVQPLVEKFKLFRQICDKAVHSLDYNLDRDLLGSLNVLLGFVQNYGDLSNLVEPSSPSRMPHSKNKDFYKDPNVEEIKSSFHLLEELRLRVAELLEEWPDQPTLKTILTIIERLYGFDITSPISRFLTGFEILLDKCREWEEVAHSGVTLGQFAQNLTHQIISWRKMELNVWKDLLNITFDRLNDPVYKWWIYLYTIMEQFITEDKFDRQELVETLQKFVTQSNLAEFQSRLNLLLGFHCHAVYLERSKKTEDFISILWNLYSYFQQFAPVVTNKIKDLRAPIEKKLKDYVKIVRWKDINYWAIKETVDRSHKTLHKYVREFQDILKQPVTSYLVNTTSDNKLENVGIWDRPQRTAVKTYHYTLDASTYMAKESLKKKLSSSVENQDSVLNRIDSYFAKSRKLCKDAILGTKYPNLIQTLDTFVTEVIEGSAHLQSLEVDKTLSKEKKKSHAKSIQQQKHRALADLFKSLVKIGLSYRAGIVGTDTKTAQDYLLRPIDIGATFSHINYNRKDEKILTIWDSCELYYLKSLMRADLLKTALKAPAPDLGIANIDRCRGFSSHLLTLAHKQKSELIKSSRLFYYLRYYTTRMTEVCEGKQFVAAEILEQVQRTMRDVTVAATQTKIILQTCPEEDFVNSETPEIVVLNPEANFMRFKRDEIWNQANSLLSEILKVSNKVTSYLEKSKGTVPGVEYDLSGSKFVPIPDLSHVQSELDNILKMFDQLGAIFGSISFCDCFKLLAAKIEQLKIALNDKIRSSVIDESLQGRVENLSEKILIVIQNIFKKYNNQIETVTEEDAPVVDEHLKVLIVENLASDVKILEMKKILTLVHEIATILFSISPNQLEGPKTIVSHSLPLLEQVILLYQYFLTQQVSAYRVTCKMSSVLLNIFIELASKGFCLPPELSESDSEGVSKPTNGMGLSEGQGEKDVSDQIESEDQLEDAQPAGQEQQNDDPDCKGEDNAIEMSEDFEGKLQDVEQKEDDEDDDNSNSDAEEQMGETDKGADQLDQEIWGSDNEEEGEDDANDEKKEGEGNTGETIGEEELGAKEKEQKGENDTPDKDSSKEKEENKKEINEMNEPEYDDQQTDPYHGNQPELPEPEPMDLPDDLQLDDGQENENEGQEENPFDIDAMKEQNPFENKPAEEEENQEEGENDEVKDYSSEDEDITTKPDENDTGNKDEGENGEESAKEAEDNDAKESTEDDASGEQEDSALDQTQTNEDNVEAMDVDDTETGDKTQASQSQKQKSNQPIEELCQEDKADKDGAGQSQMEESSTGHSAQTTAPQEMQSAKRQREEEINKPQKPGESDSSRSLGDVNEPVQKKLKAINNENENGGADENNESAEIFEHIKDATESSSQVLDAATKEQAEVQQKDLANLEEETEELSGDTLPPIDEDFEEIVEAAKQKPEKSETKSDTVKNKKQHPQGDVLDEVQEVSVEGEFVKTHTVRRGDETTHHTLYSDLTNTATARLSIEEINSLRAEVEQQLSAWNEVPAEVEADRTWQKISSVTSSLAQDLSEQLRLVLEPTQASRLKGDFRTGRRINMRKVIPYIASQFRKDKIWLRRTKPSKRDYQIVLAIDDSSSMDDNHSKELAFESVALISKALTLLESGQLSVLSFGENTEILHKLSDQFTEKSGVKLLQKFQFSQNKTCVAKLVDFVTEMFAQAHSQSAALNAKLLVVVSDGRGVFSEGETYVREAVRRAKLANIFMVFVIIDHPENKDSILDIRMPVFKDGKLLEIQNYMDVFPFSFYIILKNINSLPSVLSDALRQWFEVVSNLDKQ